MKKYEERNKIYKQAIETYGINMQSIIAIEEMAELIKEICKWFRGKADINAIAEESADVSIVLEQLQLIHDIKSGMNRYREEKLERLEHQLEEDARVPLKTHLTEHQAEIVKAFADEDMSIMSVARRLNYHYNNICYHLDKIREETGLDPRRFYDLERLLRMV